MAWYRSLKDLSNGIERGQVFPGGRLKPDSIPILESRGIIARISAPPLVELPGWKKRAEKLEAAGILDAEQFLDSDSAQLAKACRAKESLIESWKNEIIGWLTVPKPRG